MSRILVCGMTGIERHLVLAALLSAGHETVIAERPRTKIVKIPELEPIDCGGWNTKKSKGDKKKARAERRRNGGF